MCGREGRRVRPRRPAQRPRRAGRRGRLARGRRGRRGARAARGRRDRGAGAGDGGTRRGRTGAGAVRERGRGRLARGPGASRGRRRRRTRAREARHRHGPPGHPRGRAGEQCRGGGPRGTRGRAGGPDDAFRDGRRTRRRGLLRAAAADVHELGRSVEARAPAADRARGQQRRRDTQLRRALRHGPLRDLDLWHGPLRRGRRRAGTRARARAVLLCGRRQALRAGTERRLRAHLPRSEGHCDRAAADRLRRRLEAIAVQQRGRPDRGPALSTRRDREHGQHHRGGGRWRNRGGCAAAGRC